MFSLESAIVVPLCFLLLLILVISSAGLYDEIHAECEMEGKEAIRRRDNRYIILSNESSYKTVHRKSVYINPVKLTDFLNIINDTKNTISDNLSIFDDLKGIFTE